MKRSASGLCGSFGSNRISAKNNADVMSAIEKQLVGWPVTACVVERAESIRRCVAMFFSGEIPVAGSVVMSRRFYSAFHVSVVSAFSQTAFGPAEAGHYE